MKDGRICWGLLGAGAIVDRWIKGALQHEDMEIAAVASRSVERVRATAARWGIPEALSYEALLERKDIDVVYVAAPHTGHREMTLRALDKGKAVLVEKPAGVNAGEFEEMSAAARKRGLFLMEAAWTRFFPIMDDIRALAADAEHGIGPIRAISSAFSFRIPDEEVATSRLTDPARAGGGLLDVGVYDLHFAEAVLGRPALDITGYASFATDALQIPVDEQAMFVTRYEGGVLASGACAVRTSMPDTAWVYGTRGFCEVKRFWSPSEMTVTTPEGVRTVERPVPQRVEGITDEGYSYEVAHVNDCLRKGLIESPVVPHSATLGILRLCDSLRQSWGLRYPGE